MAGKDDHTAITSSRLGLELQDPLADQAWYLIEARDPDAALEELSEALPWSDVELTLIGASTPRELVGGPSRPGAGIVRGTCGWTEADYEELDRLRDLVRRQWPVLIWVTNHEGVARLTHNAPNFASFFQATAGSWSEGMMSAGEAEVRLEQLRTRWELSDDAFVHAVERGELGSEPEHQVWLILLGRPDLIPDVESDGDL